MGQTPQYRVAHNAHNALTAILVVLCAAPTTMSRADDPVASGTLATLRRDVRQGVPKAPQQEVEPEPPPEKKPPRRNSTSHDYHDPYHDHDYVGFKLLMFTLATPFWLPAAAVGDQYTFASEFLDYPYQHDMPGVMVICPNAGSPSKPWLVRVAGEYGDDFDRMAFGRGHVLIDTLTRFGIDAEWTYRREDLAAGNLLHDDLWNGDANLTFRFAETEWLQMRTGIGINWIADDGGDDVGFNFTYGGDLLPCDPWIISAEIDWGKIGHAGLFHGRLTVGAQIDAIEFYTGYDYFDVGTAQSDAIVAGVRLWF